MPLRRPESLLDAEIQIELRESESACGSRHEPRRKRRQPVAGRARSAHHSVRRNDAAAPADPRRAHHRHMLQNATLARQTAAETLTWVSDLRIKYLFGKYCDKKLEFVDELLE